MAYPLLDNPLLCKQVVNRLDMNGPGSTVLPLEKEGGQQRALRGVCHRENGFEKIFTSIWISAHWDFHLDLGFCCC